MNECKHEFMVTNWSVSEKKKHASGLMCKKCLMILDNDDIIKLQNMRSELKKKAKEEE